MTVNGHAGSGKLNRLKDSASPYLRQHASNPVNWYEWGEEAFARAVAENKPIFLSIGYSTCHWCHVMAHESFEDSTVASMMNSTFVSIKVDREERPDIDKVYMNVCQMLTGQGGWPLTVIMTPNKKPFFAGTYFPKSGRYGRIGMLELVPRIDEIWKTRRNDLEQDALKVVEALRESSAPVSSDHKLDAALLEKAYESLAARYDTTFAGFGEAPKFPTPHNLTFLLRWWKRSGDTQALAMAVRTLRAMRLGGIYDQVGYGFHRYSTDRQWRVPHFEKMLYDQALISLACLEAWQASGDPLLERTAREVFTYALRDLRAPGGAFYSAEDADSEGQEGKFYLWNLAQLQKLLTPDQLDLAAAVWDVSEQGNFHDEASGQPTGENILHIQAGYPELAGELGLSEKQLHTRLNEIREILFKERVKRVRPGLDDKILADWNGLMAVALARGAVLLNDSQYADAAEAALEFILTEMSAPDGRLLHRWAAGKAGVTATLDDYAFVVWALLELYEADFDPRHLERALKLNSQMIEHYGAPEGGFYFTADDAEELLTRQIELYDGATPSGNSVAALNLLRLARITGDDNLAGLAEKIGAVFNANIRQAPSAFTQFLCALDFAFGPSREVVVSAAGDRDAAIELARRLQRPFVPNKIILLKDGGPLDKIAPFTVPLASQDGRPTVYVCVDYACELPTTSAERALELLER